LKTVAVIGSGRVSPGSDLYETAVEVGRLVAGKGYALVCGGLFGVMEGACRGAKEAGGLTVGILPHYSWEANDFVDLKIPTGLGHARNVIVAASSPIVIAVGGEYGTLSEVALALKLKRRVIGYRTWKVSGIENYEDSQDFLRAVADSL